MQTCHNLQRVGGDNIKYLKKPLPDFKNPDIWKNLKFQCYDGTLDYEDYPADEYKYFDKLRITYLEYKFNNLPKDKAAERERLLLKEYQQAKQTEARELEVYREYQSNIKRLDSLRIEINKAAALKEKLRAALEIVGIVTGDGDFTRRNLKGIEENETR